MEELKPCPFCGEYVETKKDNLGYWDVECSWDGCFLADRDNYPYDNKEQAIYAKTEGIEQAVGVLRYERDKVQSQLTKANKEIERLEALRGGGWDA